MSSGLERDLSISCLYAKTSLPVCCLDINAHMMKLMLQRGKHRWVMRARACDMLFTTEEVIDVVKCCAARTEDVIKMLEWKGLAGVWLRSVRKMMVRVFKIGGKMESMRVTDTKDGGEEHIQRIQENAFYREFL